MIISVPDIRGTTVHVVISVEVQSTNTGKDVSEIIAEA
jgi:hypothetical protein